MSYRFKFKTKMGKHYHLDRTTGKRKLYQAGDIIAVECKSELGNILDKLEPLDPEPPEGGYISNKHRMVKRVARKGKPAAYDVINLETETVVNDAPLTKEEAEALTHDLVST